MVQSSVSPPGRNPKQRETACISPPSVKAERRKATNVQRSTFDAHRLVSNVLGNGDADSESHIGWSGRLLAAAVVALPKWGVWRNGAELSLGGQDHVAEHG